MRELDKSDDPDDAYVGRFEWWRHIPSGVVLAVRLNARDQVTGAVRPTLAHELERSAKGFEWEKVQEESPDLLGYVRRRRTEFKKISNAVLKPLAGQRTDLSDLDALRPG